MSWLYPYEWKGIMNKEVMENILEHLGEYRIMGATSPNSAGYAYRAGDMFGIEDSIYMIAKLSAENKALKARASEKAYAQIIKSANI